MTAPTGSLDGKVVIVTGGLGGIGAATARLLAGAGARVVVTDVVDDGGKDLAEELSGLRGEASFVPADLTDEAQVQALVQHAVDWFGRLDGAFNNAGVSQAGTPLVELTSEAFESVLRTNALSVFLCLKHQMAAMADGGSVVNTSSALGVMGALGQAGYIASKHAVCGLTRAAAVEGAERGIRVNAILPGVVDTPMQTAAHGSVDAQASQERARRLHLLGRMAEPQEVGHLARWLLSDEASFVTGALLPVEGGLLAGRRL
ncbi:SDR family NAD(P)-dependent oxidoreductase [Pseudonocardia broussonetiae]|uniref:SDR family oxidoreductase n=1 Tax=Pseudonocardia broussonetiae TaxID=2736640 RepID=A0A6M6JK41_9PSEU|nr:SDR family NAD(P)-dependent oxidoreductase [Pseudonocardia broussonetiae]QJY47420.1 SDR family oxidoreductase [Pseudonocardia broussonetiae]